MDEQSRKCKMISLRLSAEEYEALHSLYPRFGARNLSDFARLAMQRVIGHPLPAPPFEANKILELDERVSALEERVAHLLDSVKEMA